MSWQWRYETGDGQDIGHSHIFDSQPEAEAWLAESYDELDGIDQVVLVADDVEVYGPMSLRAE